RRCWSLRGPLLGSGADEDQAAVGAGDRTLDKEQTLLGVHGVNLQALHGRADVTHPPRHASAPENAARGGAATDGTRRPVLALRAVRRTQTAEAVALHDTGEALALALASDVDVLAGFEGVSQDRKSTGLNPS